MTRRSAQRHIVNQPLVFCISKVCYMLVTVSLQCLIQCFCGKLLEYLALVCFGCVHVCLHNYVCMYVCVCVCVCVCVYIHVYVYIHCVCMCACVYIHVHVLCVCVYIMCRFSYSKDML